MNISLRDLRAAKRALLAPCRLHPEHHSANCPVCHSHAAMQQEKQWRQAREIAHTAYLERTKR